jgi:thioredoxin 2
MSAEARHIVCPHCHATNRVPTDKPAQAAKCGQCHKTLFDGHPAAVTAKGFDAHIQKNDIPVLVDFWADWCGPCKMMAPVFERVAAEMEPAIRFLKLDTEAAPDVAARYNIRSIPMLILFRKGVIVAQQAGAMDANTLRAWLRQNTAGSAAA